MINKIKLGQYLTIGALISTTISPPLANIFIGLIILVCVSSTEIRHKSLLFFKSKLGIACLAFIITTLLGIIYGIESTSIVLSSIWGWRKFLLLPIASILFLADDTARNNLIKVLFLACIFFCFYSFLCLAFPVISFKPSQIGIVIRNSATQSLIFSVALIIGFLFFLKEKSWGIKKTSYGIATVLFLINIGLITTSRSSYLALILMLWVLFFSINKNEPLHKKILPSAICSFIIALFLLTNPQSKNRIDVAKEEFKSAQTHSEPTSVGLRLIFWENTIKIIPNYLFPGAGVGGFEKAYRDTIVGKTGVDAMPAADPHNQYLKILIEQGIFGLVFFCLILFYLFNVSEINFSHTIGVCTLSGFMLTSLFNSHFSTFNEGQFIWIFAGALLGSQYHTSNFWASNQDNPN